MLYSHCREALLKHKAALGFCEGHLRAALVACVTVCTRRVGVVMFAECEHECVFDMKYYAKHSSQSHK